MIACLKMSSTKHFPKKGCDTVVLELTLYTFFPKTKRIFNNHCAMKQIMSRLATVKN